MVQRMNLLQMENRALRAENANLKGGVQQMQEALNRINGEKMGMELRNALFIKHFAPDTLRVEIAKTESDAFLDDIRAAADGVYEVKAGDDHEAGVLWFELGTRPAPLREGTAPPPPIDGPGAPPAPPEPASKPDLMLVTADVMKHLPPPPSKP